MQKTIQHSFFYSHPPKVVWEYLTKAELMEQWLMKSDFLPVLGHDFKFQISPMPNYHFDGIIYCKVIEIIPFKKLSYSWKAGPGNDKITLDSVVNWRLEPKDKGTELYLEHSGFYEVDIIALYSLMNEGWRKNITIISQLINEVKNAAPRS